MHLNGRTYHLIRHRINIGFHLCVLCVGALCPLCPKCQSVGLREAQSWACS